MLWVLVWTASVRIPPTAPDIKQWSIIRYYKNDWNDLSLQIFSFTNETLIFIPISAAAASKKKKRL